MVGKQWHYWLMCAGARAFNLVKLQCRLREQDHDIIIRVSQSFLLISSKL